MIGERATRRSTDPTPRDLAADLAEFAAGVRMHELPSEVVYAVRANIVDTLVCAVAGAEAPAVDIVRDLVVGWGGREEADIWVFGGRVPAHHAAWVNSVLAHARDYDDTHDAAILHAGVSVVPSAVAAAQVAGAGGDDLVAAVTAGLETVCRLGSAVTVDIVETGFIYSSLLGYFGAAAAAGRALRLTSEQIWDALGIVYSSVAGNHQVSRDASLMKRMQPGLAAQSGVVAAQLAQLGVGGAREVFEGLDGFNRVYLADRVDVDAARRDLGTYFELLNLSYKPYPCCRDTHSAVDAALIAREQTGRPAGDIARIKVGVTAPGYQMVCHPEPVRRAPRTVVEAQFSIPYTVAVAWIDGAVRLAHFTQDSIDNRRDVMALAARVEPYVDPDIDSAWRRYVTPAVVTVEFVDGTSSEVVVEYAKGHPRNPMTAPERRAKARDCFALDARLPVAASDELARAVARLGPGTVDDLLGPMLPGGVVAADRIQEQTAESTEHQEEHIR